MAMDDLYKALQMFQSNVNDFQMSEVLRGANREVATIKASAMKEEEKRAALFNISNSLVNQMGQLGAPVSSIAQQALAAGPQQFANGDQAILEGNLQGRPDLVKSGIDSNTASKNDELNLAREQRAWMSAEKALDREAEAGKAGQKQSAKPLPVAILTQLQASDDVMMMGNELAEITRANPDLVGILAGRIPARGAADADFAAFRAQLGRFFDKYRVATTGQAASEKEMEMLLKRMAQETDTPEAFEKKLAGYLNETNAIRKRKLTNYKRGKYDVSEFEEDISGLTLKSQTSEAPAEKIVTLRDKTTGQMIKARIGKDGKAYPVQ